MLDVQRSTFFSNQGRVAESGLRHSTRNRAWGNPPWVRIPPLPPPSIGSKPIASGTFIAYNSFSMIQANCRARFTASDFDFVVRTLARSQSESVSLVDLLADSETRDSVIDSPRLVETILCNDSQLRISSQFYFYVLARYVLRDAGIRDRKL